MRRFLEYSLVALAVALLCSCASRSNGSSSAEAVPEPIEGATVRDFPPPPSAPSMMTGGTEINEYVATHFWDAFLDKAYFCDSTHVNGVSSDEVERALGKYITILENCPLDFSKKAVAGFFAWVEKFQSSNPSSNVFGFFEGMMNKYLYDPNSPVRDEDLYLQYVSRLAKSKLTDEAMKAAYSHDAKMCSLNQVGSKAADIDFTDLEGKRRNLHGIKAGHTLLFFSNPGCPACKEIIEEIESNRRIESLVKSGDLAVVNVYIDLEREKWQELAHEYPSTWYNGYDHNYKIRQDVTYNVRAIPSLYVLDSDKRVIMKDAPMEKVMPYLENIIQKHEN